MKNFILGFLFGAITLGAVVVYADIGVLYNSLNQPVGVTANPLYIEVVE